jgi:hypothetical protein
MALGRTFKFTPGEKVTALEANETYLQNLLKRTKRYSDITQKQDADSLRKLLVRHNNYVPDLILEITLDAEKNG